MIQWEFKKVLSQMDTKKYKYEYDDLPTFESISTPTALKWKKRIEKIKKLK